MSSPVSSLSGCDYHDEFDPGCGQCQRQPDVAVHRLGAAWYGKLDTTLFGWYRHPDYPRPLQMVAVRADHALVLVAGAGRQKIRVVVHHEEWAKGEWKRSW